MKQMKIHTNRIKEIIELTYNAIDLIRDVNLREKIRRIFDDDKFIDRYFSAPASHRVSFHNCCVGGLADHTLNVMNAAINLNKVCGNICSSDDIIVCSLLHDIGKLGDPDGEDYYLPQTSTWHQEKLGEYYLINDKLSYMPHAHRSIWWILHYQIPVTIEQYKAILIHDGQYVEENKIYAHKEGLLATIIHQADNLATNAERENYKKFCEEN